MHENFGVGGGLEDGAAGLQFGPKFPGVHQIAVMGDGQAVVPKTDLEGLSIAQKRGPGGGITDMPHGNVALEFPGKVTFAENLAHQAHALLLADLIPVPGDNPG